MATESEKKQQGLAAYQTVCDALTHYDLKFAEHKEDLVITLSVTGKATPVNVMIVVNEDRQDISFMSRLNFPVKDDVRPRMAAAVCMANCTLAFGNFDYDIPKSIVSYRLSHCFFNTPLNRGLIMVLISRLVTVVEAYYDRFRALGAGVLDLKNFVKQENEQSS